MYQIFGVELCIVASNLSTMTVEYFHPKTTPDMSVVKAVRASMSIPCTNTTTYTVTQAQLHLSYIILHCLNIYTYVIYSSIVRFNNQFLLCVVLMQPVSDGDHLYVDGGLICNFPVHAYDGIYLNNILLWRLPIAKNKILYTIRVLHKK